MDWFLLALSLDQRMRWAHRTKSWDFISWVGSPDWGLWQKPGELSSAPKFLPQLSKKNGWHSHSAQQNGDVKPCDPAPPHPFHRPLETTRITPLEKGILAAVVCVTCPPYCSALRPLSWLHYPKPAWASVLFCHSAIWVRRQTQRFSQHFWKQSRFSPVVTQNPPLLQYRCHKPKPPPSCLVFYQQNGLSCSLHSVPSIHWLSITATGRDRERE